MSYRNTGKKDSGNTISRDSAYLSANDGLLIPACSADKSIVIYDVLSYGSGKLGTAVDGGGTQLCFINAGQNRFGISAIVPAGQGVYTNAQSGNITITYAVVDGLSVGSIRNTVTGGGGATTTTAAPTTTTAAPTTTTPTTTTTTAAAAASNACVAQTSGNEYYWNVDSTFTPVVGANATHYSRTQYVNADGSLWLAYNGTATRWKINDGVNEGGSEWYESDNDGTNPWDAAWTNAYVGVTEKANATHCYPTGTPNLCIDNDGYDENGTFIPYNTYNGKPVWVLAADDGSGDIGVDSSYNGYTAFVWNDGSTWRITDGGWGGMVTNGYAAYSFDTSSDNDGANPWDATWTNISGTSPVQGNCALYCPNELTFSGFSDSSANGLYYTASQTYNGKESYYNYYYLGWSSTNSRWEIWDSDWGTGTLQAYSTGGTGHTGPCPCPTTWYNAVLLTTEGSCS